MRRMISSLLVGSLAFGLIAAAAVGAGFSVSIQDLVIAGTTSAESELTVIAQFCDGAYDIEWDVAGDEVVGYTATRTPPAGDDDPGLEYCALQPYVLQMTTGGGILDTGTTDASGDIIGGFAGMSIGVEFFIDGNLIELEIGPEAF